MNLLKSLFTSVDSRYLLKSYIISIIIAILPFISGEITLPIAIFAIVNAILFPFAALVWDELSNLLFGDITFILPIIFLLLFKSFKILFIFSFSIFIAPFGIGYLLLRNYTSKEK